MELPVEYTEALKIAERYYFVWAGREMGHLQYSDGRHKPLTIAAAHSTVCLVCKEEDMFPGSRANVIDDGPNGIAAANSKEADWYYHKRRLPPPRLMSAADRVYVFFVFRHVGSYVL